MGNKVWQWEEVIEKNSSNEFLEYEIIVRREGANKAIYSTKGYHPTIPSQESAGRFFIYEEGIKKVRKLSIEECYKIMGFPKNFKKSEKPGERYKQIGNSVAVNVVDQIAKQIIEQKLLDENYVHKYDVLDKMIFQDHVA